MMNPPALIRYNDYGDWAAYEDAIYAEYLATVAHAGLRFQAASVKVQFRPETKHKGYGFWHLISEAPDPSNRNEDERTPDLARCDESGGSRGAFSTQSKPASRGGERAPRPKPMW